MGGRSRRRPGNAASISRSATDENPLADQTSSPGDRGWGAVQAKEPGLDPETESSAGELQEKAASASQYGHSFSKVEVGAAGLRASPSSAPGLDVREMVLGQMKTATDEAAGPPIGSPGLLSAPERSVRQGTAPVQASGVLQMLTINDIPTAEARFTAWAGQAANRPLEAESNADYIRRFAASLQPADGLSLGMHQHLGNRLTLVKAANAVTTFREYTELGLPQDGWHTFWFELGLGMTLQNDNWRVATEEGRLAFNAIVTRVIKSDTVRDRFYTWVSANPRQGTGTAAHLLAFRDAMWADNYTLVTREAVAILQQKYTDVAGLPAGKIQDATVMLSCSPQAIDRNTAAKLTSNTIRAFYIEDLAQPPDAVARITAAHLDPAAYFCYTDPVSGAFYLVQRISDGFAPLGTGRIFGLRANTLARWCIVLVHETSHNINNDPGDSSFDHYKGEFRAYWVAEFRHVADPDTRAAQVKAHILQSYPGIKASYDTNPAFKLQVDGHTRPDGNMDNS